MGKTVKILMTEFVTHDVKRFIVERPKGYDFLPGQATEVSVNLPGYADQKRPFTFTSLAEDLVLEFTIKGYPRGGVTQKLHELGPGDELILRDVWGTIDFKGPGVFIAAGAGITPFIAILRRLRSDEGLANNILIVSNKTAKDVILEMELREMLGRNLILTLTREPVPGYLHRRIDRVFLQEYVNDFSRNFYVCGPEQFNADMIGALGELGAAPDNIVFEQ